MFPITQEHKDAILYMIKKNVNLKSFCKGGITPIDEIYFLFQQDYEKQNVEKYVYALAS